MKMSGTRTAAIGVITGVTLLTSGIEIAEGAVVSEPEVFTIFRTSPMAPPTQSMLLNFNQFDPALGTLTAVTFGLNSETATGARIAVFAGPSGASGSATNHRSFEIAVNSPNIGTIFGPQLVNVGTSCTTGPGGFCTNANGNVGAFLGTFAVDTTAMADFVGSGTFDALLQFSSILDVFCGGEGASCQPVPGGSFISWEGELAVNYTFDPAVVAPPAPAAVPVPGTLLLLGVGIAGLGLSRRGRKEPSPS